MIRRSLIIILALFIPSCDNNDVKDVQYYLNHPDERKAMRNKCKNNPGELRNSPNCINASKAEREAFFKKLRQSTEKSRTKSQKAQENLKSGN